MHKVLLPFGRRACLISRRFLFPIAVVLATVLTYLRFKDLGYVQQPEFIREVQNITSRVKMKNIVWYKLYHGGLRMDAQRVDMNKCDYKHCQISFIDNKMEEKKMLQYADAVLFQGGRLTYKPPTHAHLDQVFIFANVESPLHLQFSKKSQVKTWANMINWTMTYRTDSDILYKYGDIVPRPNSSENSEDQNFITVFRNKTKQVAWFVSDCKTESLRELYVKKLKQFIDVDVYGQCGTLHTCSKERGTNCLTEVARDYRFYLSFENSLCRDYMTEKVYSWFDKDIITVVRGAINYSALLPQDTYIDTSEFKSVKTLAQFLKRVGESEKLYITYLKGKAKYMTKSYKEQVQDAYCEVCKRLHNLDSYRKHYSNVYKWWMAGSCQRRVGDLS